MPVLAIVGFVVVKCVDFKKIFLRQLFSLCLLVRMAPYEITDSLGYNLL